MPEIAPRISPLPPEDYPDQLETFLSGLSAPGVPSRIRELNVVRTLANHPDLAVAYMTFGTHVLGRSSLPPRVRELVTLRTAWLCNSMYEWSAHARRASGAGLSDEEVEATKEGSGHPIWPEFERSVLRGAEQLRADTTIGDEVWNVLSSQLDERQLLDFVFTVGCYVMLAMALNGLQVDQEPA